MYLHGSLVTKEILGISSRERELPSVRGSLQRHDEKDIADIPVQSQSYYAYYGLSAGYVQLHHVPNVQTQCRFVKYNKFSRNILIWNTVWILGALWLTKESYVLSEFKYFFIHFTDVYHLQSVWRSHAKCCYFVIRHSVDNTSIYSRTTEECREHSLTARVSKFLLH